MADDFDNSDEIRNLSDEELTSHIRAELTSQKAFDSDDIELSVSNGAVTVSGRVGTEEEHLADFSSRDTEGTHDVQDAIEGAEPWIPPESPTPEGIGGSDQGRLGSDAER